MIENIFCLPAYFSGLYNLPFQTPISFDLFLAFWLASLCLASHFGFYLNFTVLCFCTDAALF
uniref:Uncharacterized protein n=1 Tax=Meloidogyne enterolobii TaxID=390850 RepID=A0A6V7V6T4_MELEN|nr:unnamed protein product [Meloidogyne enterolobii]